MKKALIIDDEAPARALIKEYLSDFPDIIVLGEANNGVDALRLIHEFQPDLIFLDVQMPGMTGLELLNHLETLPEIIFSTAYDQYAIQAFEFNAVDYLLKPYTKSRFQKAVNKVITRDNPAFDQLTSLVEKLGSQSDEHFTGKIFVQHGNHLKAINARDIIWLEAEKDYTWIITAEKRYLSSYGMGQLEDKLPKSQFVRVHRSSIVSLEHIDEIDKHSASYDLRMANGDAVRVSRSYLDEIKKRLL
ncbi:MAG: LytR/AlgR family response regulator transcription factor [Bacteroidia bacterium]